MIQKNYQITLLTTRPGLRLDFCDYVVLDIFGIHTFFIRNVFFFKSASALLNFFTNYASNVV